MSDYNTSATYQRDFAYQALKDVVFRFRERGDQELFERLYRELVRSRLLEEANTDTLLEIFDKAKEGEPVESIISRLSDPARATRIEEETSSGTNEPAEADTSRQIKRQRSSPELICKVCLNSSVAMLLFPCSHLVTCVSCTTALFECPVCRATIKGTVNIKF